MTATLRHASPLSKIQATLMTLRRPPYSERKVWCVGRFATTLRHASPYAGCRARVLERTAGFDTASPSASYTATLRRTRYLVGGEARPGPAADARRKPEGAA